MSQTTRYGKAFTDAWDAAHQKLQRRVGWAEHQGPLPNVEGTLIRLVVDRLPGDRHPKPVWLWCSATGLEPSEVDRMWRCYLRRFDVEHTFRMVKQTLGWAKPRLRDPQAADRWTWLIIVAYTQLRLARDLTADLRRPWERPAGLHLGEELGRSGGSGTSRGVAEPPGAGQRGRSSLVGRARW